MKIDWRQHERDCICGMVEGLLDLAGRELNGRYQHPALVGLVALPGGEFVVATSPCGLARDEVDRLLTGALAQLRKSNSSHRSDK
jgi:hypothetical protein